MKLDNGDCFIVSSEHNKIIFTKIKQPHNFISGLDIDTYVPVQTDNIKEELI